MEGLETSNRLLELRDWFHGRRTWHIIPLFFLAFSFSFAQTADIVELKVTHRLEEPLSEIKKRSHNDNLETLVLSLLRVIKSVSF